MPDSESTYLETSHPLPPASPSSQKSGLIIKIMPTRTRGQSKSNQASGSEYAASEMTSPTHDVPEKQSNTPPEYQVTSRGRRTKAVMYNENTENEDNDEDELYAFSPTNKAEDPLDTKPSEGVDESPDDEDEHPPRRATRRSTRNLSGFVVEDEDDKSDYGGYAARRKQKRANASKKKAKSLSRQARRSSQRIKSAGAKDEDDQYVDEPTSPDADGDTEEEDVQEPMDTSDLEITEPKPEPEPEQEPDEDTDGKHYALRQRQKINYAIPPPLEDMPRPQPKINGIRNGGGRNGYGRGRKGPGWSATGAELGRWMGMGGDDSDSDHPTRTPRKQPFGPMAPFNGAMGAGGMLAGDLTAGTPSNLGRVGDAALADADPLGVNQNVTFDEVGGLDDHIHSLKEMTLLPLLYPDVFQRFNVTPPRGVLFHGPPGTGKTLLARALAASCRSNGRSISFFMRKGADCLSKWVGEAERQLRLLFEEARSSQPSIIFFDEIDGLAPVRSSKQDQIHASIVSTLLALMDGMDGRGQVIVIGATNRPDAIDPALRRPGRFDREFYFPLPGLEAREKILSIMTKGWKGWGEGEDEKSKEKISGLARLTKGYGGADLRALCTEAALNAVQRRYPQIYKSTERLLLKPETIDVQLRDFMISIKKLVPSSARSSTSVAAPLPQQFVSVLGDALEKAKNVINRVLPLEKKLSALEEAEFEDEGEDGALDREMLLQSMQTLRVHRPRIVIHGSIGMGQNYVGAAALHHLEGYHIQSLELGILLGDSTRTVEAAIVQLFVEAKRHQPSIIYIPSLISWCAAISETSRSTVRAMLDTLSPTEPILLLAIVDGKFSDLPRDVKQWFGHMKENRIAITAPTAQQREEFFASLIQDIRRPPTQFPDGVKRRKRILEELPVAPPLEPREPSAAELAVQYENDQRTITLLKYRLGPILTDLKRKFKRFTKRASEEYNYDFSEPQQVVQVETTAVAATTTTVTTSVQTEMQANGIVEVVDQEQQQQQQQIMINGHPNPGSSAALPLGPQLHDIDLERMHVDLYRGRYLTPQDFLIDIEKMVWNAEMRAYEDMDRLYKAQAMLTAAQVSIQEFDPLLKLECERMAVRERQRREEHRRNKGKEREREKEREEAANGIGVRRSTRNTGQTLEISITDPVQLERKLKRQRGESAGSSHGEEDERASGQERDSKRSRMSTEDEERAQPIANSQGGFPVQSQAHRSVHFASEVVQPSAPVQMTVESPKPIPPVVLSEPDHMVIDDPNPRSGFDPALLNPLPPSEDVFSRGSRRGSPMGSHSPQSMASQTLSHLLNPPLPTEFNFPSTTSDNPFFVQQPVPSNEVIPRTPSPRLQTPLSTSEVPVSTAPLPNPDSIETTMIDPRPISPPLPDFHVDDELLGTLCRQLVDNTAPLAIEQLEQLRATCLGNVWRHRTEWDRDELIRELLQNVKEFVEDVNDLEWNDSDDS